MDQQEARGSLAGASTSENSPVSLPYSLGPGTSSAIPQTCSSCGSGSIANNGQVSTPSYVYAIGRIEPRFPRPSVEKELAQATRRTEASGLTDRQALQKVLSQPRNRYIARQLCWVMTIEGLETYILVPRDPADLSLLVETLRTTPSSVDLDCVIGLRGPLAATDMCNGLVVPIVMFDQIYSFDRDALIKAIPRQGLSDKDFAPAAAEVFERIMQATDNAGAADEHRALNYLALRYQAIYANGADAFARNASLSAVQVRRSPLSGTRNIMDVIFSYTHRNTDVTEKFSVRVDVTEEFPFLVTKLSPYYDH